MKINWVLWKERVRTLSVDAGSIWIATAELVEKYGGEPNDDVVFIPFVGQGKVAARTRGWNGACQATLKASTEKGFYIGDLCYVIREDRWRDFCNECLGHTSNTPAEGVEGLATVNTGGDGSFKTTIRVYRPEKAS